MLWRRDELGGLLPERRVSYDGAEAPGRKSPTRSSSREPRRRSRRLPRRRAFVRLLRSLLRDEEIGKRIVPIIPDEARTFGMESLFKQLKIYNPLGQRYEPVDVETLLPYLEAEDGQVLEEGITEAGSMARFTAAGTSYATHERADDPVLHLLFDVRLPACRRPHLGLRRCAGPWIPDGRNRRTHDADGRGPAAPGRALAAVGIDRSQHARVRPGLAYELATIIREGLRRMYEEGEDVFYYLTLYNEPYVRRRCRAESTDGILKGLYRFKRSSAKNGPRVQLLASGPILRLAMEAQDL